MVNDSLLFSSCSSCESVTPYVFFLSVLFLLLINVLVIFDVVVRSIRNSSLYFVPDKFCQVRFCKNPFEILYSLSNVFFLSATFLDFFLPHLYEERSKCLNCEDFLFPMTGLTSENNPEVHLYFYRILIMSGK